MTEKKGEQEPEGQQGRENPQSAGDEPQVPIVPGTTSADVEAMGIDVNARAGEHPAIDRTSPGGIETAEGPLSAADAAAEKSAEESK